MIKVLRMMPLMVPVMVLVLVLNYFCSCVSKDNGISAEDQIEAICCVSGYLSDSYDRKYLSSEFGFLIKKSWENRSHEPWDIMWQIGSSPQIHNFHVNGVWAKEKSMIRVSCVCDIYDGDEPYIVETFYFDLIKENGEWLIDDIEHSEETAREALS